MSRTRMKAPPLVSLVVFLLGWSTLPLTAQVPNPGSEGRIALKWSDDYNGVLSRAKSERKPVLIDFTTDWCGWSKKMDRETFAKRDVQKELREFILIRLNPEANDRNKEIGEKFLVSSYPTLVVVNYNGEETGRREGYMEAPEMLKFLKEQLPLFKGNPLGYKQVKLDPSDPFFAAIKLLPKPEAMPPEIGYVTVLDYSTVDITPDGKAKYEIRSTYYITDEERDDIPMPSIAYNPSRQKASFKSVRILDQNGEGREVDLRLVEDKNLYSSENIYWDTKTLSLAMPALKKGQVLDVIETKEETPVVPGEFYFQWNTGGRIMLDSDLTIRFPSKLAMQKVPVKCTAAVTETRNNDGTTTWRLKTSHRENDEYELFSGREDYYEGYDFYAGCDRNKLAKWFSGLCAGRDLLTPAAKVRVAEIVKKHASQKERVQALMDWVTKDVRYVSVMFKLATHQPHSVEETLKNGYGDCKDQMLVLQTLCREAGIASRPVLLGAPYKEEVFRDRPSVEMFGHCILEATVDGKPMYLDPTAGPGPAGHVPQSYAGQFALRIDGQEGTAVKLPGYEPRTPEFTHREITLNPNGSGTITETRTLTGERAKEAKKEIKPGEVDKMRKNYEASYKRAGSKLLDFSITDSLDPGSNFVMKVSFTSPRIAQRTAAGLLLHLGEKPSAWLDRLDAPRTKPFRFQPTDWVSGEVVATLPGKPKEMPGNLEFKTEFMEMSRKVTLQGNQIRITEKSRMLDSTVAAKEAARVVETFRKISDHQYYAFVVDVANTSADKKME